MTLRFQMRRDDALEFNRQYHLASPTCRWTRLRVRWVLPVILIGLWGLTTLRSDFPLPGVAVFLGVSLWWFLFYPARYDRHVRKYCEKILDEGSCRKTYGSYALTLSVSGLHFDANGQPV